MRNVFFNRTWKILGYNSVNYEGYSFIDVMACLIDRDQRFGEFF
jgi:hypothetical protein